MPEPDDKTRLISLADAAGKTRAVNKTKPVDFLDYLHIQKVKEGSRKRISLEQVKKELALD